MRPKILEHWSHPESQCDIKRKWVTGLLWVVIGLIFAVAAWCAKFGGL